jgi:hypothetical protein
VFREQLAQLGWADGRNLRIDYRWSGGDIGRVKAFAKELVELSPDIVVGQATPSVLALQQQTHSIPIVFMLVADPVGQGIVASLAHPGSNITGFQDFEISLGTKWMEALKTVPQVVAALSSQGRSVGHRSELDLLRDCERIVDLDPEIANGALQLGVAEQQLNRSQVAGLSVNLSSLRSAQRVCAVRRTIEAGALDPTMDDAGVLPCREMRPQPETAWKQVSTSTSVKGSQPLADRAPGLFCDLELHRPAGFFLDHGRSLANPPAGAHLIDPHPNEVATSELAVDGQIEHRKIALAVLQLQANTNCPDILRLQRTLLAVQATLVPRVAAPRGNGIFDGHGRLRRSRPLPPLRPIAVDRPRAPYPEKALSAESRHFRGFDRTAKFYR